MVYLCRRAQKHLADGRQPITLCHVEIMTSAIAGRQGFVLNQALNAVMFRPGHGKSQGATSGTNRRQETRNQPTQNLAPDGLRTVHA